MWLNTRPRANPAIVHVERIVITGAGIISALGNGCTATLEALLARRSGVGRVCYLDTSLSQFPVAEVPMDNDALKRLADVSEPATRSHLMGVVAVREAMQQARLLDINGRVALLSGTTVGGMDRFEREYPSLLAGEGDMAYFDAQSCGACTRMIADAFPGCFDYIDTPSTACSSALNSIIIGARLLRTGRADVVVAGGSECLTRYHLSGFRSLMILDQQPCRPFDKGRAGLNLGEGAAYVVMERESDAQRRGAQVLAVLSGCGNACDAFHQTATSPDGRGARLAMRQALAQAGLTTADIDYVNAHGTGTPNNDASESAALRQVFGDNLPPVSSTKAFTGHTTSASGSIEAVICLLAMREGFVPPQLNWQEADPDRVTPVTELLQRPLQHVLCNSFGFGGNDSSIILSRP